MYPNLRNCWSNNRSAFVDDWKTLICNQGNINNSHIYLRSFFASVVEYVNSLSSDEIVAGDTATVEAVEPYRYCNSVARLGRKQLEKQ